MANLTRNQKRCEDCPCLIVKDGKWACDECFGQLVEDIDDCPEGVTVEMIEELDKKAKENKINHGASGDKPRAKTERKPRPASDEKQRLFATVHASLVEEFGENVEIAKENKLILVKIGEKHFKIDLIEQRPPKK